MPAASLSDFGLADKSPGELEQHRLALVEKMRTDYNGYDDPNVPIEMLTQLALVTATLRRKNSGPPKVAKTKTTKEKASTDDFMV